MLIGTYFSGSYSAFNAFGSSDWLNGGEKPTKTGIARWFSFEPNVRPLLKAMRDETTDGEARVIDMPGDTNLARGFRFYLERAGVTRAELHAKSDDPTRKPISFHDLRATGITWMAIRGDEPLRIQQRAGHTDFQTTQIYIREAEAVRDGFGEVFPALPECLLRQDKGVNRLANRPRNRPKTMQRRGMSAEREGFESDGTSTSEPDTARSASDASARSVLCWTRKCAIRGGLGRFGTIPRPRGGSPAMGACCTDCGGPCGTAKAP